MATFSKFDAADHLNSRETIAFYLTDALETDDSDFIRHALGTIARVKGVVAAAASVGLSLEDLDKSQDPRAPLEFDTVCRLLGAAGVKFVAKPIETA